MNLNDPGITDPSRRRPIEEAPHDGTVIQVGGPYEWTRCHWEGRYFALYAPDTMKDGSAFDMTDKKFWRPDDGKG